MKRTTLLLEPSLYTELKQRAAKEGRTLTEVVERTLRAGLRSVAAGRRSVIALPSYDLGPFLVELGESSATRRARRGGADEAEVGR